MLSNRSDALPLTLPDRISIVGNTGSGKSTLGSQLAKRLGCPFIELDALHWEPNWRSAPDELFRERVRQATAGDRWVIDGNYNRVRDIYEARLQMLVWLDYPLAINLWRLTCRGLQRIVTREDLWNSGNRETFRGQFLSRDSLYVWAIKTHRKKQKRYLAVMDDPDFSHITVIRLRSPRKTRNWLDGLCAVQ